MDFYAKTESERHAKEELEKRRRLRIVQVRQQTTDWMTNTRKRYDAEKSHQIENIISEAANRRENQMLTTIQEMAKYHEDELEKIGSAHQAADLENQKKLNRRDQLEKIKCNKIAFKRHIQALKSNRENIVEENAATSKLRQLKEKVRHDEDIIAKELVVLQPYPVPLAPSRTEAGKQLAKLYQQSLTQWLYVPGEGKDHKLVKKRRPLMGKFKGTGSKERKKIAPPVEKAVLPSVFNIVADERAAGATTPVLIIRKELPDNTTEQAKNYQRKGSGDVLFFDASIPHPPQRYIAPPGLVQRISTESNKSSAWTEGMKMNEESQKVKSQELLDVRERERRTVLRGKKALKIARLEQRYKQLEASLLDDNQLQSFQPILDSSTRNSLLGLTPLDLQKVEVEPESSPSASSNGLMPIPELRPHVDSTVSSSSIAFLSSTESYPTPDNMSSTISSSSIAFLSMSNSKSSSETPKSLPPPNGNKTSTISSSSMAFLSMSTSTSRETEKSSRIDSLSSTILSSSIAFASSAYGTEGSSSTTNTTSGTSSSGSTLAIVHVKCFSPKKPDRIPTQWNETDSSLSDVLNTLCIRQGDRIDQNRNQGRKNDVQLKPMNKSAFNSSASTSSILSQAKKLLNTDKENINQIFRQPSNESELCRHIISENTEELDHGTFSLNMCNLFGPSPIESERASSELQSTAASSAFQRLTMEWDNVFIDKPSWIQEKTNCAGSC